MVVIWWCLVVFGVEGTLSLRVELQIRIKIRLLAPNLNYFALLCSI